MRACADVWSQRGEAEIEWDARSLYDFGDGPLEGVAHEYDLLVIDHPLCGAAAAAKDMLLPLDELLDAATLAEFGTLSIGPSQDAYAFAGHVWALAADAACQVSAFSHGLGVEADPVTWHDALALARSLGRRAALPLSPPHALCSLLTLWAGAGLDPFRDGVMVDPERGLEQLELLIELHALGHPSAICWEPPEALEALTAGVIEYIPLTYGYASYSAVGAPGNGCRFANIPGIAGSVLGGAGIAVSAHSRNPEAAARFAAWVCAQDTQLHLVGPSGGQVASAPCWSDRHLDAITGGFYGATRATTESAWVRPRHAWWPSFQLRAGEQLTEGLEQQEPARQLLQRLLDTHGQLTADRGATSQT